METKKQLGDYLFNISLAYKEPLNNLKTRTKGDVLDIIAFKPQKTAYGDTFIICIREDNGFKAYYSNKQLTNYLSKILQDGKNNIKQIYTFYYMQRHDILINILKAKIKDITTAQTDIN